MLILSGIQAGVGVREFQGDEVGQVLRLLARQSKINMVVERPDPARDNGDDASRGRHSVAGDRDHRESQGALHG
jgi:hypothetical protein